MSDKLINYILSDIRVLHSLGFASVLLSVICWNDTSTFYDFLRLFSLTYLFFLSMIILDWIETQIKVFIAILELDNGDRDKLYTYMDRDFLLRYVDEKFFSRKAILIFQKYSILSALTYGDGNKIKTQYALRQDFQKTINLIRMILR